MGLLYSNYECNPVTNNSLRINAVSGTLAKTFKKSYFVRFPKGSEQEKAYFDDEKGSFRCKWDSYYGWIDKIEIVVLQVMLCADDNYLVEAIDKEDYEEMFKGGDVDGKEEIQDR